MQTLNEPFYLLSVLALQVECQGEVEVGLVDLS